MRDRGQGHDSIVQYTWDSLGRALTEKQGPNPFGTAAMTVTLAYDAEGNTTQIDYPSGFEAHRTFDAIHRLSAIDDGSSNDVADFALYGGGGRRKQLSFGNGTTSAYTYDGFRRPTAIDHDTSGSSNFASFDYGWDANDNPLYEARGHLSGKGDAYTYDQANRLVQVLEDATDPTSPTVYVDKIDYNLDDVLNFTSVVTTPYGGSAATLSYTTNGMNEYTAVGGTSRTFDDNGNLTDDGTYEYSYDFHNHLIKVVLSGTSTVVAEYTYDAVGRGRRTGKTVGSDTTRFVYHDQQCIEEYDGSDDLLRLFVFGTGLDEVVMMEAPDIADVDGDQNTTELKQFYFHTQLIGSVTQVTDPDEVVVESYDYGPYGETAIFDQSSSSVSTSQIGNPFLFTGRRLDEETGLYYYRARHYDSESGRFIQRDPLEYVEGPNARAYVLSRPMMRVDPTGLLTIPYPIPWGEIIRDALTAAGRVAGQAASAVGEVAGSTLLAPAALILGPLCVTCGVGDTFTIAESTLDDAFWEIANVIAGRWAIEEVVENTGGCFCSFLEVERRDGPDKEQEHTAKYLCPCYGDAMCQDACELAARLYAKTMTRVHRKQFKVKFIKGECEYF